MFQPIELDDKHITRIERVQPIEYKHRVLKIHLPEEITTIHKSDIDIEDLVNNLENIYNLIISGKIKTENWYYFAFLSLMRLSIIEDSLILKYVIHHMIDIEYLNKKKLINFIYYKSEPLSTFEQKIKEYLDTFTITYRKMKGILFVAENKIQFMIFGDTELRMCLPTEFTKLSPLIEKRNPDINEMNDIIGFMSVFKSEYIVFKVKNLTHKRSAGARCDQIAKKTKVISLLNNITGFKDYLTVVKQKTNLRRQKKIGTHQLCCELELILRHYNYIKKDGKHWFLSPPDSKLLEIESSRVHKN